MRPAPLHAWRGGRGATPGDRRRKGLPGGASSSRGPTGFLAHTLGKQRHRDGEQGEGTPPAASQGQMRPKARHCHLSQACCPARLEARIGT